MIEVVLFFSGGDRIAPVLDEQTPGLCRLSCPSAAQDLALHAFDVE
jgi:hypothetical protein